MATKTPQISNISRFRVQFPVEPDNGSFETISGVDMCEPDNSLSIPEIIARYTRGQGLGVEARPWQVGSADEEGYNPMDVEGFDDDLIPDQGSAQEPAQGSAQEPAQGSAQESAQGSAQEPAQGSAQEPE